MAVAALPDDAREPGPPQPLQQLPTKREAPWEALKRVSSSTTSPLPRHHPKGLVEPAQCQECQLVCVPQHLLKNFKKGLCA